MRVSVKIMQEVEIKTIVIDIAPRHIGDSDDDDMPTDFPLLNSNKAFWQARVDIDTGVIEGWPQGDAREMNVKVCDQGRYTLLDADSKEVARIIDDYVPNGVVPGEYGDYVELSIDETGRITNWPEKPDVSAFFDEVDYL